MRAHKCLRADLVHADDLCSSRQVLRPDLRQLRQHYSVRVVSSGSDLRRSCVRDGRVHADDVCRSRQELRPDLGRLRRDHSVRIVSHGSALRRHCVHHGLHADDLRRSGEELRPGLGRLRRHPSMRVVSCGSDLRRSWVRDGRGRGRGRGRGHVHADNLRRSGHELRLGLRWLRRYASVRIVSRGSGLRRACLHGRPLGTSLATPLGLDWRGAHWVERAGRVRSRAAAAAARLSESRGLVRCESGARLRRP